MRWSPSAAAVAATLVGLSLARRADAQRMSTSPELAYDLGEVQSARSVGMGGALDALGVSTVAMSLNPANMPLARVYHIEATGALSPEAKRQSYTLAIVDSVLNTSHVAGGLLGNWSQIDPDGLDRTWTDVRAGLAVPFGDHLALGATGRWLRVEQAVGAGPFGASDASGGTAGGPLFNQLTFDAGATAALGDSLRIAVVGHNLTNPGTGLAPTTASAGVGYTAPNFSIEGDGLLDFTTYAGTQGRLMIGGEAFLADHYALRAGWRYDSGTNANTPSLGFGYIDARWSIEVGVRHDLLASRASTLAVLSLRYFYDAGVTTTPSELPDTM